MHSPPWLVFAGGGTGGHLFPALAALEVLRGRTQPYDVTFFCTDRAIDQEILGRWGVETVPLPVRPFSTRPWHWPAFWLKWRAAVRHCEKRFEVRRPVAVIGAGGYASGPPVRGAINLGIPTFLLNPDAVPGRANLHFGRQVGLSGIFAQWDVTRAHFPPNAPVCVTGCPVRRVFRDAATADPAEARRSFDLEPDRRTLLVTGASQGARTINQAMIRLGGQVASAGWQVLHLSGSADRDEVARSYEAAGARCTVLPFTDRMADAMAASDLIVSRAGASTLAEILAVGKPAVLFPYPFHRDRHQWHNGDVLVQAGAAVMLEDCRKASGNAEALEPVLTVLMRDDVQRAAMAASARGLGRPEAAADVADRLAKCLVAGGERGIENSRDRPVRFLSHRPT